MSIIGIDFGSNAVVIGQALGMSGGPGRGGIDVVLNGNSQRRTPNIVSFVDNERFLGEQAEPYVRTKVTNTISTLNRLIGHSYSEDFIQNEIKRLPYKVIQLENDKIGIQVQYNDTKQVFSPEQITAMILAHCCELAQKAQNNYAKPDVVIAIPAYWTDSQRRAMKNACAIADISCLGIVNASTAICVDYGIFRNLKGQFDPEKPTNVLFYDMGYADTVASVVSYYQGKFVVRALAYDMNLGGRNVDDIIINMIATEFKNKYKIDPRENAKSYVKLSTAAEKAKKTLSPLGVDRCPISIECLSEDHDYNGMLTLQALQDACAAAKLPERVQAVLLDALNQCGMKVEDISFTEICGGGVRVPQLRKAIAEIMKTDLSANNFGLSTTLNMDETVGKGCAVRCAMLSPRIRIKDVTIEDRNLYNITISINGQQSMLFPRFCSFPQEKILTLPGYNTYCIDISYSEDNNLPRNFNEHIASIIIDQDDKMKEEGASITLSISLDHEGCIKYNYTQVSIPQPDEVIEKPVTPVAAPEKKEGATSPAPAPAPEQPKTVTEKRPVPPKVYNLNARVVYNMMDITELNNCKTLEQTMRDRDNLIRATRHAKNELETFVYATRDRLDGIYKPYILPEDAEKIQSNLMKEEDWLYTYDGDHSSKDVYETRLKDLMAQTHGCVSRYEEAEQRTPLINKFNQVINFCMTSLQSTDPKYDHIPAEERKPLIDKTIACKEWFDKTYNALLVQAATEDPVLKCNDLKVKGNNIYEEVYKLLSKPKPAPKVEEKKEEKPATPTTPKTEEGKDIDIKEKKEEEQKMDIEEDTKKN
ncbi:hypothetical protein WA158_007027 [Blastocystis sp. Blastoise]